MKILLFNLGSISDRINAWGIEGFKSIFEQDVVLWGPIPDEIFMYNDKKIPIISFFAETSIKTVFERLPKNWIPDIVTCDTSVLNFVPDLYLCPVKTVLFSRDAWADTIYNRSLVEFFDSLNYCVIDRSLYYRYKVNTLPVSNCAVSVPDTNVILPEFEKRDIDVICIANWNSGFYHDRYKTLYKLSDSNRSGINIKYVSGIERKEINSYYRRSKIVIDRSHTLSNRSYEALLNGCLLFCHEENSLIKDFWIPGEEYIPYSEDNIMQLVKFYLNNPDIAKEVTSKAYEKAKTIPSSLGESYWEHIRLTYDTDINIQERIKRVEAIPKADLYYRLATPLVYNYNYSTNYPENWQELYFQRIDSAISNSSDGISKILPLIEASRMAFLLKESRLSDRYLSELEMELPDYAWIYYLRARKQYLQNNMDQALAFTKKAIDCCNKAPDLLQKFVMPLVEKNNNCDSRRITDYLWQPVYGHNNEFQVKSLFHLAFELMGDIYHKKGEINNAINTYSEAVSYIAILRCIHKLSKLLIESGNFKKLYDIIEKGREDSPYDSSLVFYGAYALYQVNQKEKAFGLLKKHKHALLSFSGKKRIAIVNKYISIIFLLKPFGRYLFCKAINFILKVLDKGE